ncbi:GNAT family N-acetyltransferase [Microseira sp. BLCC-F43]|uniref:GNAT family N-acetyltransferase n=1 Tax=Microseira sp. BLCC-F43 TaxID=3153602 RepID=UPI0035BA247E
MTWIISAIDGIGRSTSSLRKDPFNSGNPELDRYLKQYALQNDRDGISRTFVAFSSEVSQMSAGYYSCCAGAFASENFPVDLRVSLPRYPTRVILIGKLAVDRSMQGRGLGKHLLFHALENALNVSQKVEFFAVRVDAIDETAKEFYTKFGFRALPDIPLSLYLRIETFKQALM